MTPSTRTYCHIVSLAASAVRCHRRIAASACRLQIQYRDSIRSTVQVYSSAVMRQMSPSHGAEVRFTHPLFFLHTQSLHTMYVRMRRRSFIMIELFALFSTHDCLDCLIRTGVCTPVSLIDCHLQSIGEMLMEVACIAITFFRL